MIKKIWHWIRFGKILKTIKAEINGTACEIEYTGRKGKVIGYWAYGYFDPKYPYQG